MREALLSLVISYTHHGVVAWDVYSRIMESYEAKSYFLSCKMQRNVFLKVVMIETHANENYTGILEAT